MEYTIWRRYDPSQVMVFGINDGESTELASSFVRNFGLTYPVLHDPRRDVYFNYNVGGITPYPRDVIIDQEGIIRYIHSEYDPQVMIRTIDELLELASVEDQNSGNFPKTFRLKAYPNPFNPQTTVQFESITQETVDLEVFDLQGRLVFKKSLGRFSAGQIVKKKLNFASRPSGVYYLRLRSGKTQEVIKLVVVR